MGFINMNLGKVKELRAAPAGRHHLTVANAELGESREKKSPQFKLTINIDDVPDAYPVSHWLSLPSPKDDEKTAGAKALFLKRFLVLFGVPHSDDGFDPDDLIGASADAELILTDPEENDNREVFNRLVVPKLRTEGDNEGPVPVDTQIARNLGGAKPAARRARA